MIFILWLLWNTLFFKEAVIEPHQFTFNKFVRFYMQLMERYEIDKLFDST